ncbi:hypothetical protein EON63_18320 [archaeon]|nr:MAG: hypothetical protein EON63_18320 [archaeon]
MWSHNLYYTHSHSRTHIYAHTHTHNHTYPYTIPITLTSLGITIAKVMNQSRWRVIAAFVLLSALDFLAVYREIRRYVVYVYGCLNG